MNAGQVADFCLRYLEATGCRILEKSPAHVKVKLSPEADRDLTGRSYYWNFVERTGAEPETMSFVFVFDPERHAELQGKNTDREGKARGEREGRYHSRRLSGHHPPRAPAGPDAGGDAGLRHEPAGPDDFGSAGERRLPAAV